jgi:hypothetical protein
MASQGGPDRVKIVVLAKPVPDATGQERLGPDLRLDRAAIPPVINGNDEYVLEAASEGPGPIRWHWSLVAEG